MRGLLLAAGVMAVAAIGTACAEDASFNLGKNCGSCHALARPADASRSIGSGDLAPCAFEIAWAASPT